MTANDQRESLPLDKGFRTTGGTHTSRTIMLAELSTLLEVVPPAAAKPGYVNAVIADNALGKRTASTRKLTVQRLSELYALDPATALFRLLRFFWQLDRDGRPLLAFLCAYARDPLLRMTAPAVLNVPLGSVVNAAALDAAIGEALPRHFNPSTQHKIARNALSSWTQSGHLQGRSKKVKTRPKLTPTNIAYALALGYLAGARGNMLFKSIWASVLDAPEDQIKDLAIEASRRGWLTYRGIGSTVEVRFPEHVVSSGGIR